MNAGWQQPTVTVAAGEAGEKRAAKRRMRAPRVVLADSPTRCLTRRILFHRNEFFYSHVTILATRKHDTRDPLSNAILVQPGLKIRRVESSRRRMKMWSYRQVL